MVVSHPIFAKAQMVSWKFDTYAIGIERYEDGMADANMVLSGSDVAGRILNIFVSELIEIY